MNDNERYMLTNLKKIPYLGAWHQIIVCARKRRTTTTGVVIYIFLKRSLDSSHQRRYSEVSCASLAALWALLCCNLKQKRISRSLTADHRMCQKTAHNYHRNWDLYRLQKITGQLSSTPIQRSIVCQPRRSVGSVVLYGIQRRCTKWFYEHEKIQTCFLCSLLKRRG